MTATPHFLVVGAGLSGSVIAREFAEAGCPCHVVEAASHVGGHCHTARDPDTGILVHVHGPHTFHSSDERAWSFAKRFATFSDYRHKKCAMVRGELYELPINLSTLRRFFARDFSSEEAVSFLTSQAVRSPDPPRNFEEAALATVGRPLYEAFYRGYTRKQWGRDPAELPPSLFQRVPIRFDESRNYFHDDRQGQPIGGYTALIERVLQHPLVRLDLGRTFDPEEDRSNYTHTFWSGPIDRFFKCSRGGLSYRTLKFEDVRKTGTHQPCSVINHCDGNVPFTRVTEHKHFAKWERHSETVISYEYSSECGPNDEPFYPVRSASDCALLGEYVKLALQIPGVSFVGRLGSYRYIDMDRAIVEAREAARRTLAGLANGMQPPPFFVDLLNAA